MSERPEHEAETGGDPHAVPGRSEYDELEDELADLFATHFDAPRANLELTPAQQERSKHNATAALARIYSIPRESTPQLQPRRTPKGRGRWSLQVGWSVATGAMVAIIAVIATIVTLPSTPPPAAYAVTPELLEVRAPEAVSYPLIGTDPAAALTRLSRTAAAQPGFGTEDTQIVTRVGWWLDSDENRPGQRRVVPTQSEVRQLPDGTTRIVVRREEPLRQGSTTIELHEGSVTSDETFPRDPNSALDHPEELPTDSAELASALLGSGDACEGFRAYCLAEMISTLNLNFVLSPQLAAGLIRTLNGNDDITYAGTTRDRLGRQVDVFAINDPDRQRQYLLMFDPQTGYFAGRETVLLVSQPDLDTLDVPTVVEFDAVSERRRDNASGG